MPVSQNSKGIHAWLTSDFHRRGARRIPGATTRRRSRTQSSCSTSRPRHCGFLPHQIRCLLPELGPIVGYAVTSQTRAAAPEPDEPKQDLLGDYLRYVEKTPGPRSRSAGTWTTRPAWAAQFGEVTATIHQKLGCVGHITSGCPRDLDEVRALGFPALRLESLRQPCVRPAGRVRHAGQYCRHRRSGRRLDSRRQARRLLDSARGRPASWPRRARKSRRRERPLLECCRSDQFSLEEYIKLQGRHPREDSRISSPSAAGRPGWKAFSPPVHRGMNLGSRGYSTRSIFSARVPRQSASCCAAPRAENTIGRSHFHDHRNPSRDLPRRTAGGDGSAVVPILTKAGLEVVVEAGAGPRPDFPMRNTPRGCQDRAGACRGLRDGRDHCAGALSRLERRNRQGRPAALAPRSDPDRVSAAAGLDRDDPGDRRAGRDVVFGGADAADDSGQSMDALSSMATISGYKAVVVAADLLPRLFPMMTTAAGTITPARVLVIGAGVAGLQAIATARRLGAVVSAYDMRAASKEQVQSLGGRFVELADRGRWTPRTPAVTARRRMRRSTTGSASCWDRSSSQSDVVITRRRDPRQKIAGAGHTRSGLADGARLGDHRHGRRARRELRGDQARRADRRVRRDRHRLVQPREHRALSRQPDVCTKLQRVSASSREGRQARAESKLTRSSARRCSPRAARSSTLACSNSSAAPKAGLRSGSEARLVTSLYVFMLAGFIGFEVIRRVSPLLHTPLMSLTNALDAIAVVGAIILAGSQKSPLARRFSARSRSSPRPATWSAGS